MNPPSPRLWAFASSLLVAGPLTIRNIPMAAAAVTKSRDAGEEVS